jgi:glucosylceramidase
MIFPAILALSLSTASGSLCGNFRRDHYLSKKDYDEEFAKAPKEGGRIQLISKADAQLDAAQPFTVDTGAFSLKLDPSLVDPDAPKSPVSDDVDWVRSYYDAASGTVLTTLHVHTDKELSKLSKLLVKDSSGKILTDDTMDSNFAKESDVQVTYATTRNGFKELVVHVHNYGSSDKTIKSVDLLNGMQSTGGFSIKAGAHHVFLMDVSSLALSELSIWTISLDIDGDATYCGGGRLVKEHYPMEDWPKGDQTPYDADGCDQKEFKTLQDDLRLDTHFYKHHKCGDDVDDSTVFDAAVASQSTDKPWFLLPSESFWTDEQSKMPPASASPAIAGAFIGDESDSSVEDSWKVWWRQLTAEANMKKQGMKIATYDGGHVNNFNGEFAGVSDIQGMDFYVAGCAPHITAWTDNMLIQGAYDYLANTRLNMMPLPAWGYTQAFCTDCWNKRPLKTPELLVQFASVLASGMKGIMLFQSDIRSKDADEDAWNHAGKFMQSVQLLQETLRVSDAQGAKFETSANENGGAIVSVLGGPETSIVMFINTNAGGYSDKTCAVPTGGQHWEWKEVKVDSTVVTLNQNLVDAASAAGMKPSEYFGVYEVNGDKYVSNPDDVTVDFDDDKGTFTLKNTKLGASVSVVRSFILKSKAQSSVSAATTPRDKSPVMMEVVQTAQDTGDRLTKKADVKMDATAESSADYSLKVSVDDVQQEMVGFGGAFTDSTAFNFQQLPEDKQEEFLNAYFGENGHRYSLCRLTIGSSDFSVSHYNYANVSNDWDLVKFSIEHDMQYIIPMINRAQKVAAKYGNTLQFVASPWSPPAWLKRNNRMVNSMMPGLMQEDKAFKTWALYLSKYLSAYKEVGIDIERITVQNEAHVAKQFAVTYECCGFAPDNERDFVRDYLGPQLAADHPTVGILIHDDQKNDVMVDMVKTVMDDTKAAPYVAGVAFHWYDNWGLNYDVLDQVHELYPNMLLLGTEATNPRPLDENIGNRVWQYGEKYAMDMLRDFNHHASGFIDWNMLLDYRGGPSNQHLGDKLVDLGNCDAPIRTNFTSFPFFPVDDPKGTYNLIYQPAYYCIGHFTRFVPPGTHSVKMTQSPAPSAPNKQGLSTSLESTAFVAKEADGSKHVVAVVTNFVADSTTFKIEVDGVGAAVVKMPPQSIQTLKIPL